MIVACFKRLSRYLFGKMKKRDERSQRELLVSGKPFELDTSRIFNRSANCSTVTLGHIIAVDQESEPSCDDPYSLHILQLTPINLECS
jgi:hypothetical protein